MSRLDRSNSRVTPRKKVSAGSSDIAQVYDPDVDFERPRDLGLSLFRSTLGDVSWLSWGQWWRLAVTLCVLLTVLTFVVWSADWIISSTVVTVVGN